jgi:hypothetical protein
LAGWLKGTLKSMPYAVLIAWHEPQDDLNNWYFCMAKISGFPKFSMHKLKYPNVPFALRPVPHDDSVPLLELSKSYTLDSDSETEDNKKWPLHAEITQGQKNVAHMASVDQSQVYLRPLRIKLAFIKIFVKSMDKQGKEFSYLREKFPK